MSCQSKMMMVAAGAPAEPQEDPGAVAGVVKNVGGARRPHGEHGRAVPEEGPDPQPGVLAAPRASPEENAPTVVTEVADALRVDDGG
mmetsp:Transcript_54597/g.130260  ORF Transcript_54597/g.130260 Transcript_54597/m.130260 type:complete len:87 (-) Transcript_54597:23-283(-)